MLPRGCSKGKFEAQKAHYSWKAFLWKIGADQEIVSTNHLGR